jgi:hypothetical protein
MVFSAAMRPILLLALLAVTAVSPLAQSQTLNATEAAMIRAVDAGNAENLALLERLVNINSGR